MYYVHKEPNSADAGELTHQNEFKILPSFPSTINPSIHYVSIHQSIHQSIHRFSHPSIYPPTHAASRSSIRPSIRPSIHPTTHPCISYHPSVHPRNRAHSSTAATAAAASRQQQHRGSRQQCSACCSSVRHRAVSAASSSRKPEKPWSNSACGSVRRAQFRLGTSKILKSQSSWAPPVLLARRTHFLWRVCRACIDPSRPPGDVDAYGGR
jgi:hypothetical protein